MQANGHHLPMLEIRQAIGFAISSTIRNDSVPLCIMEAYASPRFPGRVEQDTSFNYTSIVHWAEMRARLDKLLRDFMRPALPYESLKWDGHAPCSRCGIAHPFDEFVGKGACDKYEPAKHPWETMLRWNNGTVVRLANAIYDDKAFRNCGVLHDALLDAGCDCEPVLEHLREDRKHVRGCWVLELLRGEDNG